MPSLTAVARCICSSGGGCGVRRRLPLLWRRRRPTDRPSERASERAPMAQATDRGRGRGRERGRERERETENGNEKGEKRPKECASVALSLSACHSQWQRARERHNLAQHSFAAGRQWKSPPPPLKGALVAISTHSPVCHSADCLYRSLSRSAIATATAIAIAIAIAMATAFLRPQLFAVPPTLGPHPAHGLQ